jgi:hypothetical protein
MNRWKATLRMRRKAFLKKLPMTGGAVRREREEECNS